MARNSTGLVWFRRDLRLEDNPALHAALASCERVIPVYIHAPDEEGAGAPGAASRWWLHRSLEAFSDSLARLGSRLFIRQGDSLAQLQQLAQETGARQVFWNRLYEPAITQRDSGIKRHLTDDGITAHSFNAALLFEPWQLLKGDDTPYRVFTPYWKTMQRRGLLRETLPAPARLPPVPATLDSSPLGALSLLPERNWADGFEAHWQPGERGARLQLQHFLEADLLDYDAGRDIPARPATSRLSPHLHFGEIGPRQIAAAIEIQRHGEQTPGLLANGESYLRELAWREFAHYLLYHFPHTQESPFDTRFEQFSWNRTEPALLSAWQQGRTGLPIVDAGMRELWQTGWMHNRVRMIAASLLSKNLLYPWLEGAAWFHDTLVDADLAANTLGWQWTAGCGADAAPFFRIFNPVLQGQKFDKQGRYVRRWVPELASLPDNYLHRPWEAPPRVLSEAGIILGEHYPRPVVDLKTSRQDALERFARIKRTR